MKEELVILLGNLGAEGIAAFYVYLALNYASLWVVIGLCIWGAKTVWTKIKGDL